MQNRIKQLREHEGLTQQKFADRLHIKRGAVANYEVGRNTPTDSVIALICREFDVNEHWLRTGEGEMFLPKSSDDELAEFMGSILREDIRTSVRKQIITALSKIPPEMWDGIAEVAQQRAAQYKNDLPPNDEEGR